ncbi:hypothetical protein ABPG77_008805 [Micractinium sp. CCAP 211/92]
MLWPHWPGLWPSACAGSPPAYLLCWRAVASSTFPSLLPALARPLSRHARTLYRTKPFLACSLHSVAPLIYPPHQFIAAAAVCVQASHTQPDHRKGEIVMCRGFATGSNMPQLLFCWRTCIGLESSMHCFRPSSACSMGPPPTT